MSDRQPSRSQRLAILAAIALATTLAYAWLGAYRGIALHHQLQAVQDVLSHPERLKAILRSRLARHPNDLQAKRLLEKLG